LSELRRVFEDERNSWMDNEEAEWLDLVQPYQNVVSTLKYTEVRRALLLHLHVM
jgi:hypothetical protein